MAWMMLGTVIVTVPAGSPAFLVALFGAATGFGAMVHHQHSLGAAATVIQLHVHGMFLPSFFTGSLIARFGVGWNFLYVGGTTLLTTTYTAAERGRAQATNDLSIFLVGLAASLSGKLPTRSASSIAMNVLDALAPLKQWTTTGVSAWTRSPEKGRVPLWPCSNEFPYRQSRRR